MPCHPHYYYPPGRSALPLLNTPASYGYDEGLSRHYYPVPATAPDAPEGQQTEMCAPCEAVVNAARAMDQWIREQVAKIGDSLRQCGCCLVSGPESQEAQRPSGPSADDQLTGTSPTTPHWGNAAHPRALQQRDGPPAASYPLPHPLPHPHHMEFVAAHSRPAPLRPIYPATATPPLMGPQHQQAPRTMSAAPRPRPPIYPCGPGPAVIVAGPLNGGLQPGEGGVHVHVHDSSSQQPTSHHHEAAPAMPPTREEDHHGQATTTEEDKVEREEEREDADVAVAVDESVPRPAEEAPHDSLHEEGVSAAPDCDQEMSSGLSIVDLHSEAAQPTPAAAPSAPLSPSPAPHYTMVHSGQAADCLHQRDSISFAHIQEGSRSLLCVRKTTATTRQRTEPPQLYLLSHHHATRTRRPADQLPDADPSAAHGKGIIPPILWPAVLNDLSYGRHGSGGAADNPQTAYVDQLSPPGQAPPSVGQWAQRYLDYPGWQPSDDYWSMGATALSMLSLSSDCTAHDLKPPFFIMKAMMKFFIMKAMMKTYQELGDASDDEWTPGKWHMRAVQLASIVADACDVGPRQMEDADGGGQWEGQEGEQEQEDEPDSGEEVGAGQGEGQGEHDDEPEEYKWVKSAVNRNLSRYHWVEDDVREAVFGPLRAEQPSASLQPTPAERAAVEALHSKKGDSFTLDIAAKTILAETIVSPSPYERTVAMAERAVRMLVLLVKLWAGVVYPTQDGLP
ncbi:unnamed protein product [Vitrella brassicaformis CCMP3155]|uniref:Uncharacterized protein n=1 Tax=Vitrella brassicaformis (strain CCMP3155) TaxID=1169540 RepID=A0A0G4GI14_VITBC|nr:unnamed protein product [Vitrella brassicaformis CCMP3155]|eukprot:CEM29392.1 unnamed protein product [Vitrella brassicaformis CCMP3155]